MYKGKSGKIKQHSQQNCYKKALLIGLKGLC